MLMSGPRLKLIAIGAAQTKSAHPNRGTGADSEDAIHWPFIVVSGRRLSSPQVSMGAQVLPSAALAHRP